MHACMQTGNRFERLLECRLNKWQRRPDRSLARSLVHLRALADEPANLPACLSVSQAVARCDGQWLDLFILQTLLDSTTGKAT